MTGKRGGKRGEALPRVNESDTAASEWQISRDLEGAIRLGLMQAELLKSVQRQLKASQLRLGKGV